MTFKGVAQPYLSLWELSRELQQWDKSETFHDCRVDLVGELPLKSGYWGLKLGQVTNSLMKNTFFTIRTSSDKNIDILNLAVHQFFSLTPKINFGGFKNTKITAKISVN